MLNNIIIAFKQFTKRLVRKYGHGILVAIISAFIVILLMSVAGIVYATDTSADTAKIVLDTNNPTIVTIVEKRVEIKPGLANADIEKLNQGDPDAIKAYIQQKANDYDIDWKLVYAIGAYESGYFKSSLAQNNNNYFGRKATSTTWMSWNTPQEGIDNQFEYLKTRYIDKGLDTPEEMNRVYCEGDTWKYMVRNIMNNA